MARETIGEIRCRFHARPIKADVRRDRNGKLYYFCRECGPVNVHGRSFQEWMLEHARLFGAEELTA